MTRPKVGKINRGIFGERFKQKYQEGKNEGKWKSQEDFGQLFDPPASRGSVMKWCNGDNIPTSDRMKRICEIFGVNEDYFDTDNATRDELYRHSSNTITEIGKTNIDFAKEKGLSLDLIDALSGIVDFNSLFPIYLPIPDRSDCIIPNKRSHGDSAPISEEIQYMQIEREGKTITLHRCDLAYLKEVQDQIIAFVEFLFYQRSREMKKEAYLFNEDFRKLHPTMGQGVKSFDSIEDFVEAWEKAVKDSDGNEVTIAHKNLDSEVIEICRKYDRFMSYAEGTPKKRKATQKDIDNFFGNAKTKTFE